MVSLGSVGRGGASPLREITRFLYEVTSSVCKK